MIDIDLTSRPPNSDGFVVPNHDEYPILFLGFLIKNEYDNQRIEISKAFNPKNIFHLSKDRQTLTALRGIKLKPNSTVHGLIKSIQNQEKLGITLVTYQNLLSQFSFSCKETYNFFDKGIYPIDFVNLKSICDDSFNNDKKIFQHILGLDEKVFDFQKFSSLKLFILTI
jgi:hypothetical protein